MFRLQILHNCCKITPVNTETYRSGIDAYSKQSCELFVAKDGQGGFQHSEENTEAGHNGLTRNQHFQTELKIIWRRIEVVITRRTRNALGRNPSRVRISPSPPNPSRKLLGFLFESASHKCLRMPPLPQDNNKTHSVEWAFFYCGDFYRI